MRNITAAAVQMHCSRDVQENLARAEQLVRTAAAGCDYRGVKLQFYPKSVADMRRFAQPVQLVHLFPEFLVQRIEVAHGLEHCRNALVADRLQYSLFLRRRARLKLGRNKRRNFGNFAGDLRSLPLYFNYD